MGIVNYKNGLASYGVPVIPGASKVTSGNVFFVSSDIGSNSNDGKSTVRPFADIDYAIGRCTANHGDIIYVMPGHTESVTTAADIDLDVAGVSIIGMGNGEDRPTITFSTSTGADIDIDAASISIENFIFTTTIDSLAAAIDVNASDFVIKNCEFRDTTSAQTLIYLTLDENADRTVIDSCKARQNTAGAASFIRTLGGPSDVVIRGNDIVGDYSVANISNSSTASTDILIEFNNMDNKNAVDVNIDLVATTDGTIRYNTLRIATDAEVTWIDADNDCQLYQNFMVNADGEYGFQYGTASTTS